MSAGLSLHDGYDLSGLTDWTLWLHYASVGGVGGQLEVEACLLGLLTTTPHEHTVIAQALNEHFLERGEDHPVAYTADQVSAEPGGPDAVR